MRFKKGADVVSADGEKVGFVDRVVIDPETKDITHLVIGKGVLFASGNVIPIELVESTQEGQVRLEKDRDELEEALSVFEEAHFVELDETEQPFEDVDALYWYPPVGGWWNTGNILGYAMPQYVLRAERNIPDDKVALQEGARVLTADDELVGSVAKVITEDDRITHLVISAGLLLPEKKVIPSKWIHDVREHEIVLSVESGTLQSLSDYQSE